MRNPLNELLTKQEQKALLFLLICFVLGSGLNYLGFKPATPLLANKSQPGLSPDSLAKALEEDVPVIIDIRTASKEELILLPGIGAKRAQDIIDYRSAHPFKNLCEIMNVKGIGEKTFEKMRPMLLSFGSDKPIDKSHKSSDSPKAKSKAKNTETKTKKADMKNEVNINRASLQELCSLSGIGAAKAQAIIDYRTEYGPFESIEDIMKVKGIGPATFEKNKARLKI